MIYYIQEKHETTNMFNSVQSKNMLALFHQNYNRTKWLQY